MSNRDELNKLLRRNWLGKQGIESWGDFLSLRWRQFVCRIFGHAKPILKMDAPNGICSRCRIVL